MILVIINLDAYSANDLLNLNTLSVNNITNEKGLSNSAINTIFKDSYGFMWFGSWDGLNRYDGSTIITYYPEPFNEYSLSNNIIWDIFEDINRNLWIVTEQGINLYDRELDRFFSWYSSLDYLPVKEKSIRASIGPDGLPWIAIHGEGIFYYDSELQKFVPLNVQWPEENLSRNITGISVFDSLVYLLHESMQITIIHPDHRIESVSNLLLPQRFGNANTDQNWFFQINNRPHIAIAHHSAGMWLMDIHRNQGVFIQGTSEEFLVTAIHNVKEAGYTLIGTDNGDIFRLEHDSYGRSYPLRKLYELSDKKVKIWSILKTFDDLLWIGTDGNGVFQYNLNPMPFYNIRKGDPSLRHINHQIVRSVYEDTEGNVWIGTRGNGLNMIPGDGGPTRIINTENGLSSDAVLALAEDGSGNLWIGVDGKGIDVLNKKSGRIYHFPDDLKGGEGLEIESVYAICIDVFGTVWLGTSGKGVYGLTVSKITDGFRLNQHVHLPGKGDTNDLKGNIVFAIKEQKPNILWIGARMCGLHRYNSLTGEIRFFGQAIDSEQGLSNPDVLSLMIGSDNHLWIGTSGGLHRMNLARDSFTFTHFGVEQGLANHTVHAILEDSQGNIWVSTNKGLSRYLTMENRFANYNVGDGLLNVEFTDGAAFHHTQSGRFYFGGTRGVDWFYPHKIGISKYNPRVMLTGFRLYNQIVTPGDRTGVLSKGIDFVDEILLNHNQNFFSVEFATLNYHNASKNNFAYKLEGFNTDWIFNGQRREASFTNVPHGEYKLLVKATNEDGFWSDRVRSLSIVIHPPLWLTYYAYTAYFILFISLAYLLYRYQSVRMQRKQQLASDRIRQQKEKELNQYKFEFFTNLAHEFCTPLTLIFASAASIFDKMEDAHPQKSLIRIININARRLQNMINELLAFQKLDTGREKLERRRGELIGFVAEIVDIFTHFANENEVDLIFEPEVSSLKTFFDAEKIERILLNLLSNAIKYTPPGGSVAVKLHIDKESVIFNVIDTGIGIDPEELPHIFNRYYQKAAPFSDNRAIPKGSGIGLTYTKSLVELLGGEILVESKPNHGTKFSIALPLNKEGSKESLESGEIHKIDRQQLLNSISVDFLYQDDDSVVFKGQSHPLRDQPPKHRILVVDDDVQLLRLLYDLFSSSFDVVGAHNGAEAIEILKSKRIDVIVSDVIMPHIDGLTMCKQVKSDVATSHIPVILLTARSEIEQLIEGLEFGADAYIAKPFHPRHLYITINKLISSQERRISQISKDIHKSILSRDNQLPDRDRKLLEKAFSFIEQQYHRENLNADDLAEKLAMSQAQLYRKIKAITGVTPHGLIKNFRLNKARFMIAEGKNPISDIVYMTGFNNRTYFYRSYRELFGETPGEITKRLKPQIEKCDQ